MAPIPSTTISTLPRRRWRCRWRRPGGPRCAPISKCRCGWRGWSRNSRCRTKPSRPVSLQPDHAMAAERPGVGRGDRARIRRRQDVRARCDRGGAGADRAPRSGAQFLHRRHRRPRAARARAVDAAIAAGRKAGPLAGVPFAVKNLFDMKGLATRAGSKINRDLAPSPRDATLIERMEAAGAVLVGALNMGEYAYDFTGENIHDGPSRNPHDLTRMTGGSSGGSGGAVGGGLVPLALGSDTNGSIRVPSSFCGIFGLKPTYGRLSRARSFPFVASFDHLGPFARNVEDLALAYDAMQGPDRGRCGLHRAAGRAGARRCSRKTSAGCGSRSPADIFRRTCFPKRSRRSVGSPGRSAPHARSKFPRRRAPAPPPMSSPPPKVPRCISIGCASGLAISIPRCATGCWPAP